MRRALIAAFLVAGSPAIAAPRTWDAWVGDFKGMLVWRQCTARGETVVAVAIDAVDGAIRIDLTSAGAALRMFSLQQDAAGWSAQDGDLAITVAQKKPNTIDLAIAYDSGCTARGQLVRASTGVPACDALVGWARIEAACTRITDASAPLETRFKRSDAPRCTARAQKLALAIIDAGCAPHPDPQIGTRAVACRSLADATTKLARCARVPAEIMQRLSANASALSAAAQTAEKATLPFVEQQCKDARAEAVGTGVQFGCQL
jgi:hypothetical protein